MTSYWTELLGTQIYRLRGKYVTRVIEGGSGDALLLLHGTGGHAENYIRNIAPLARHFRVIAIDFLWHGRSQTEGFAPDVLPPLVDQVRDVLDTLGIERAHIEGQSLGGWVAALFAIRYPERVQRLILTTPMGYRPDEGSVPGYVAADMLPLRASSLKVLEDPSLENIRIRIERIVANPALVNDEAVAVRHIFYNDPAVNAVQRELMTNYLGGEAPQRHTLTDALAAKIALPTLVYWGEKNATPPELGQRLASVIPNAEFFCAPDTGHWAQYENHEIHNRTVLRFLSGDSGSAAGAKQG